MSAKTDAMNVVHDMEMETGVFRENEWYYIRTPTYHYVGVLKAVTPSVFVLEKSSTVYESGAYAGFFAGAVQGRIEEHVGSFELVIDRGGSVAFRIPARK